MALTVSRTFRQTNLAPPEAVFPLLCPVREREWAVGWECRVIHSVSGIAEAGCVFATPRPGEPETVWQIVRHDVESFNIQFATFTPGLRTGTMEIQLTETTLAGGRATHADIAYQYTALSPEGQVFLRAFTEPFYAEMMRDWERELNHFLRHGTMFPGENS